MPKKDSNGNPIGQSRGFRPKSTHVADWEAASADAIKRTVVAAGNCGGAIHFGYSRDGGAYSIRIYGDGDPYTEFIKPDEDIDIILESIVDLFTTIRDAQSAGSKPKK